MNYSESLKLLTSSSKFHINLGLERVEKLAKIFFSPQDSIKIIHVAGTNGKGSTCAMLAKILEKNGYKTGLYTSPHIKDYTERIKINFSDISENDFAKYIEMVENTAKSNGIDLTEFEILTMVAFLYFRDKKVDFAVFETGMGGRLDATNIIKNPILTVITSIGIDHADRLGSTIEKISAEKAGIIKEKVTVIVSQNNLGLQVIKQIAARKNSNVLLVEKNFELTDKEKNIFSDGKKSFVLSLLGNNQGENLALVIKACEFLNIKPDEGLKNVVWHGRFEKAGENFIIDAAHNPDGTKLLKQNIDTYFAGKKRAYLFGMLDTKDYKNAIKNLFNNDDEVFVTDNFAHNAINKEFLLKEIKKEFPDIKVQMLDIKNANDFKNYDFDGIKICCGSFYLISKFY